MSTQALAISDNFMTSMKVWDRQDACKDITFVKIAGLYDKFLSLDKMYVCENSIPHIIHQIWLGSAFPEKYKEFQQSWKTNHPDWQYILWTEKEIENFGLINKEKFDLAQNFGAKSDIARYEILYRIGGLYIDTDFECLKPFDYLCDRLSFFAGCISDDKFEMANGLLASCPGHPVLKHCIEKLKQSDVIGNDTWKIMENTGPYFFTRCFLEALQNNLQECVVFPLSYFFPVPATVRSEELTPANISKFKARWVKDESYAIHWWECSWMRSY
jgi:inositol phosphorylceramide mannosyltransferase catalytic subunit